MKQEEARKKHGIWKGLLSSLLTGAAVWMLAVCPDLGNPHPGTAAGRGDCLGAGNLCGEHRGGQAGGHGACPKSARCPARLVWQGGRADAPGGDDLYAGRRQRGGHRGGRMGHLFRWKVPLSQGQQRQTVLSYGTGFRGRTRLKNGGIKQCWKIRARNG